MEKLIFDVSILLKSPHGNSESYSFDIPLEFDDFKATNVKGKVTIMRIEGGIHTFLTDVETDVTMVCDKCLKKYAQNINFSEAERIFLWDKPEKVEDVNDIFLIDHKNHEIDLTEALRQEIILHFPLIPVCFNGCKGICEHCGKNRNTKECKCKKEDEKPGNKPLAILKDIFK